MTGPSVPKSVGRVDSSTFLAVRSTTTARSAPLAVEDMVVQSMPDASPTRWHLAHTTWFFETFVLRAFEPGFRPHHPLYEQLFNSYYRTIGEPLPRDRRGTLSRPTVAEIHAYRAAIDERMAALLDASRGDDGRLDDVVRLGLEHERQHQELILTDIKHAFSVNPLRPAYRASALEDTPSAEPMAWIEHAGGIVEIGAGPEGFAFDNERPRHGVLLRPFALASRLITNAEFAEFVADGGYRRPELWLSDGWQFVGDARLVGPAYVESSDTVFTLHGMQPLDPHAPVCHVSGFEADAFARWSGARLPLESEWEVVAAQRSIDGHFADSPRLHPGGPDDAAAAAGEARPRDLQNLQSGRGEWNSRGPRRELFGDVWQWTSSAYSAYPGYRPEPGAIGEYNGKFMVNQMVLRGGSCLTPRDHVRASYRNFFAPTARWQCTGIRLAKDLEPHASR